MIHSTLRETRCTAYDKMTLTTPKQAPSLHEHMTTKVNFPNAPGE
jgi:hypothetical protein